MSQDQSQSTMSPSGSDQTLTGCVVRREQAVYLEPATGGQAVRLSGNQDFGDLTHQARITGHYGSSADQSSSAADANQSQARSSIANNAGNQSSSQSSMANNPSNQSQARQEFVVTRVDTTTESCPAKASPDTSTPSATTPPPRH